MPSEDRRLIVLSLGEGTTETHCKDCRGQYDDDDGTFCGYAGGGRYLTSDGFEWLRHPLCIAAEARASQQLQQPAGRGGGLVSDMGQVNRPNAEAAAVTEESARIGAPCAP